MKPMQTPQTETPEKRTGCGSPDAACSAVGPLEQMKSEIVAGKLVDVGEGIIWNAAIDHCLAIVDRYIRIQSQPNAQSPAAVTNTKPIS